MSEHESQGAVSSGKGCCGGAEGKHEAEHGGAGESGPMGMAEKMMGLMGQGGGPMEMMHKMMSQMGASEGKPPMEKMMGMCMGMWSEILAAIRETNALAVHATPELRAAFTEWLAAVEEKALAALQEGDKDAAALGAALGTSEESARYVLMQLAARGRITLVGRNRAA